MSNNIPRVVIAGTQSGSGKTTLVTGLLAALKARGLRVQSYKVGPDYIDPGFHRLASGRPAHNLDTWLVGAEKLPALFAESAGDADIAVIEGVMGLYDGGRKGVSSTAEIAKLLDAPVLLAIDCKSMGASAAAIALGFRAFDPDVNIAGVLLNRLGSATHEQMIRAAMDAIGMPVYGAVHRDDGLHLSERHLGLTPTTEAAATETVKKMGEAALAQVAVAKIVELAKSTGALKLQPPSPKSRRTALQRRCDRFCPSGWGGGPRSGGGCGEGTAVRNAENSRRRECQSTFFDENLAVSSHDLPSPPSQSRCARQLPRRGSLSECSLRIAVAQDAAFSFYYPTSLAVLERLGAELVPFSPLDDETLPDGIAGVLLGGGFPEMFAEKLAANTSMRASIRAAAEQGLPIYAECGGYMYLMTELVDFDARAHAMCRVFPGRAVMTKRLQMVGYVTARMEEDTVLGAAGTELRGHEFHFSQEEAAETPPTTAKDSPAESGVAAETADADPPSRPFMFTKLRNGATYGAGQRYKNVLGSYLHIHFAGCPGAAERFVRACKVYREKR